MTTYYHVFVAGVAVDPPSNSPGGRWQGRQQATGDQAHQGSPGGAQGSLSL